MIIYLCIKYESNTLMFSKYIERKQIFNYFSTLKKGHNSQNNWWILPLIELDLHFMIIYLCIKFQSNNQSFQKISHGNHLCYVRDGRTDGADRPYVRTAVILYAPPPH